jgi:O-succinylbenzoate synthase
MLREVELLRVRLPLARAFRTANGVTTHKEALLVRARTDDAEGWGECSAQASPTYAPETIDTARIVLRDHLVPRAFAGAPLEEVRGNHAARAALECALLDAQLRADGVSLAAHLGASRTWIDAGVAVGLDDDASEYGALGYRRIKVKITPGEDVEVVRAARAAVGDAIDLAVDANGTFEDDDPRLDALDDFGLQCIEQPCAPDRLGANRRVDARLRTPVCLDESITSVGAALEAVGSCRAMSIKPSHVGGLGAARAVHDVCQNAGIPALAGGMLETGIGRAALVAVAALPGCTMTGDCSASARYFGDVGDITEPFVLEDGRLRVPDGPGLGVEPIASQLERFTIAREVLR